MQPYYICTSKKVKKNVKKVLDIITSSCYNSDEDKFFIIAPDKLNSNNQ